MDRLESLAAGAEALEDWTTLMISEWVPNMISDCARDCFICEDFRACWQGAGKLPPFRDTPAEADSRLRNYSPVLTR